MSGMLYYPNRHSYEFQNYERMEVVDPIDYSISKIGLLEKAPFFQGCASPILASHFLFKKEHLDLRIKPSRQRRAAEYALLICAPPGRSPTYHIFRHLRVWKS
jgi:hypothetical protein